MTRWMRSDGFGFPASGLRLSGAWRFRFGGVGWPQLALFCASEALAGFSAAATRLDSWKRAGFFSAALYGEISSRRRHRIWFVFGAYDGRRQPGFSYKSLP